MDVGVGLKESWALKNWCFWTVVLEKTLESPLDCKEIQPVHPKGDQSWVLSGRTDAEAEIPILWPPDAKSCLIGKDPDAGKDWGQRVGHDWATEVNRWLTLGKSTSNNWEVIYRKFREVPEKPATFSLDSCGSYIHGFIFSNFTELCPYVYLPAVCNTSKKLY